MPLMLGGGAMRSAQFGVYATAHRALQERFGAQPKLFGFVDAHVVAAGFAGGALFTCALCFSCLALDQNGLSLALGIWCGMATLISFLWGTIGPPNIACPLADVPLSIGGISLIILGVCTVCGLFALPSVQLCTVCEHRV